MAAIEQSNADAAFEAGLIKESVIPYVLRQIHLPGKSARADEATAPAVAGALLDGKLVYGKFLVWSDPDARDGAGEEGWSSDVRLAQRFRTTKEAIACWKAQSCVRPLRDDGKPNCPMTAITVTVEYVP